MAQKMVFTWQDEDGEIGRTQVYLADGKSPAGVVNAELFAPAMADVSGAKLVTASETDWEVVDPPAGTTVNPYDIRDKARIDLFISGGDGLMSITVPAPLASIFADSDNLPAPADLEDYPVLEAAVDEMIGRVTNDTTAGAQAAFGYAGGRRLRYERS